MANQYVNKFILGEEVKFDLTQDDVTPDKLASGIKAHDKSGAPIVGTCTFDADTRDATATAAEILSGKTAYKAGAKITGTMPNNGAKTLNITKKSTPVTVPTYSSPGSGAQANLANSLVPRANVFAAITVSTSVVKQRDCG